MSDLICFVDGCDRLVLRVKSKGLCWMHYQRVRKTGTTDLPIRVPVRDLECEIDGCDRPQHGGGSCSTHLSKMRRTGTMDGAIRACGVSSEDRFWSHVTKTETCWLFDRLASNGYGYIKADGISNAHRLAYELLVGPIPDGLQIDHLCRVRNCVNPDHLEPVTAWENTMRSTAASALNARKTECLRGHPFSDENTYYSKDGRRYCRECGRIRGRAHLDKKRGRAG